MAGIHPLIPNSFKCILQGIWERREWVSEWLSDWLTDWTNEWMSGKSARSLFGSRVQDGLVGWSWWWRWSSILFCISSCVASFGLKLDSLLIHLAMPDGNAKRQLSRRGTAIGGFRNEELLQIQIRWTDRHRPTREAKRKKKKEREEGGGISASAKRMCFASPFEVQESIETWSQKLWTVPLKLSERGILLDDTC